MPPSGYTTYMCLNITNTCDYFQKDTTSIQHDTKEYSDSIKQVVNNMISNNSIEKLNIGWMDNSTVPMAPNKLITT